MKAAFIQPHLSPLSGNLFKPNGSYREATVYGTDYKPARRAYMSIAMGETHGI